MINKIKLHNYIYGFIFSLIEFIVFELVVCPFTIYYFISGRFIYGFIALGIFLNALPIIILAIRSLVKKEKDIGILSYLKKDTRNKIHIQYRNLQRDTNLLALLLLFPFLLSILCLIDILKHRKPLYNA